MSFDYLKWLVLTQWLCRPLAQAFDLVRFHRKQRPDLYNARCPIYRQANIFFSAVIPCLIGGGINAYTLWNEHWEHWEHMAPLEERTEYPYQNIRSKNYPWGDGDKVCNPLYSEVVNRKTKSLKFPSQTIL